MSESEAYRRKSELIRRPRSLYGGKDSNYFENENTSLSSDTLTQNCTQFNRNNAHSYSHRKSFKKRFIDIFKLNKKSRSIDQSTSQIKHSNEFPEKHLTKDKLIARSTPDTTSNVELPASHLTKRKPSTRSSWKNLDNLDERDLQTISLYKQFALHKYNLQIICTMKETKCAILNLPTSLAHKLGKDYSNNVVKAFLDFIPGCQGIENHGNTCYVNVIVQCLAHIDLFAEFLVTKDFLEETQKSINWKLATTDNSEKVQSKSLDVSLGFSYLIMSLWQKNYLPKLSYKFFQLLLNYKTDYSLDSQQDAHEFLLWILNVLHENLSVEIPIASKQKESSFINDHFRTWVETETTCDICHMTKCYPDEMLSLNLLLAPPVIICTVIYITVINQQQELEFHALEIKDNTMVKDSLAGLSERLKCQAKDLILLELTENGFGSIFKPTDRMTKIIQNYPQHLQQDHFSNGLYVVFSPNQIVDVDALGIENGNEVFSLASLSSKNDMPIYSTAKKKDDNTYHLQFVRLLIVHTEDTLDSTTNINNQNLYRFSEVLTLQASRKTQSALLIYSLCEQMQKALNVRPTAGVNVPEIVVGNQYIIPNSSQYPLSDKNVLSCLADNIRIFGEDAGCFVTLTVVWSLDTHRQLFSQKMQKHFSSIQQINDDRNENIYQDESVIRLTEKYEKQKTSHKINIEDCIKATLSYAQDTWSCPQCKLPQPSHNRIKINKAPDILIVMLKRFNKLQHDTQSSNAQSVSSVSSPGSSERASPSASTASGEESSLPKPRLFPRTKSKPSVQSLKRSSQRAQSSLNNYSNSTVRAQRENSLQRQHSLQRVNSTNKSEENNFNKLECFVEYPLLDLDMAPYITSNDIAESQYEASTSPNESDNYKYNLVSVVNHRGNLQNGHYVSMCFNSIDDKWRLFDDDRVMEISRSDVVNPDAYILVYQRQTVPSPNSPIHWSYRRLAFPIQHHLSGTPNSISVQYPTNSTETPLSSHNTPVIAHSNSNIAIGNCPVGVVYVENINENDCSITSSDDDVQDRISSSHVQLSATKPYSRTPSRPPNHSANKEV